MKNKGLLIWVLAVVLFTYSTIQAMEVLSKQDVGLNRSTLLQDVPNVCPQLITALPFVEVFSPESLTVGCWTVINNNNDEITWDVPYIPGGSRNPSASIRIEGSISNADDWLISPRIRVNGHQRLRFSYHMITRIGVPIQTRTNMEILVNRLGPVNGNFLLEEFTHKITPIIQYRETGDYVEIIYDLVDQRTGLPITGDINIAFHVTGRQEGSERLYLDNIVVENIPSGNNLTLHSPVDLPYSTDFESPSSFNFMNDTQNTWVIGSAIENGGAHSLYVTNDGGVHNDYTRDILQTSHAYVDFNMPNNRETIHLDFDLRSLGNEGGTGKWQDYFKTGFEVRLLNGQYHVPVARIPISHYSTNFGSGWGLSSRRVQYGDSEVKDPPAEFERVQISIPWSETADENEIRGGIGRFNFQWSGGYDSDGVIAVAIDNINIYLTCDLVIRDRENYPNESRPSLIIENITTNSFSIVAASVNYLTEVNINAYLYDLIVSDVEIPLESLGDTSVPTHPDVYFDYEITGLSPLQRDHYVYFRPKCVSSTETVSYGDWDVQVVRTLQQPAELPFRDGFEDDNAYQWDTESILNRWIVGEAVHFSGDRSLYISDDLGESYHYTTNTPNGIATTSRRELIIPANARELYVAYDYQVNGEFRSDSPRDYFTNFINYIDLELPTSEPNRRRTLDIGEPFYVDSNGWQREVQISDIPLGMENQVVSFIYKWYNDDQNGVQPPAAIDDVVVMASGCLSPINLAATFIAGTTDVELSWEAQGDETQWEVFIIEEGEAMPEPEDRGILVEDTPSYIVTTVEEGKHYLFYVRAICGEGEFLRSFWRGPKEYFYAVDTSCIDLTKEDLDLPTSDSGDYIICEDTSIQTTLKVDYGNSRATDDYYYKAIDYAPLYPFVDQGSTEITGDDQWSEAVDLGFNFCFYGNTYSKVLLTTNAVMSFSIEGETANGQYAPGSESSGVLEKELINGTPEDAPFLDAIFGAMQDLDLQNSPADASVNYKVYGEFPCRAFVFNTYHVALEGEAYDEENIEGTTQTSQIVLYENINTIEVYLKKRPIAASGNEENNRNSVIGIVNENGSKTRTPFTRNTGNWRAAEEAWRFAPNGDSVVELQWYRNGEEYATTPAIDVLIDDEVEYIAKVTYSLCEGNEIVLEEKYNFIKEDFDVSVLPDLHACSNRQGNTKVAEIDPSSYNSVIYEHLASTDEFFKVEYFADQSLEQAIVGTVKIKGRQTVYVKVISLATGCFKVGSFDLIQIPPVELAILPNVEVCKAYVLPKVEEGAAFYTKPFGEGDRYETGYVFDQIGTTQLYVYKQTEEGCEGQSTFTVVIHEEAIAMQIEDQDLACETFVLPQPLKYNRYFTRPHGQGLELQPGQEILMPMEIFIYAKNGSAQVECIDESSFKVNYDDCPLPKGISPNGDGLNESLDLSGHGISQIKIFNRDGVEVYSHGRGYKKQWYGQNKSGKMLPSGTYYYILTSHGKQRTGWIQLMY
ncbi:MULTISPECIES: gliding motility-associated C-terminal domain-containing protein [unclassified Myroides]|uniref:T9SS type B sorting domain-containing protein n=1 Tax=unclassified Myroides TaxID=2642485 RepID=UPI003D2F52BB